jgi:hypothetical protein
MLVYTKSRVAVPSFLFTVGTDTGVIVALLTLFGLTGFLLAFCISLKHVRMKAMPSLPPDFLKGFFDSEGLPSAALWGFRLLS